MPPRSLVVRSLATLLSGAILLGAASWLLGLLRSDSAAPLSWAWISLGSVLWACALPLQAWRWRALLPAGTTRHVEIAALVTGANALNLTLPGPGGEVAAAAWLWRRRGVPIWIAVGSALAARVLALALLGVLLLLALPGVPASSAGAAGMRVAALAVGLASASLFVLIAVPRPVAGAVGAWCGRLGWGRAASAVARVGWQLDSLASVSRRRWFEASLWSVGSTGVLGLATACGFAATGAVPSPLSLGYVHLLASLGAVFSLVVPGGAGTTEAIWAGVLPLVSDLSVADALAGALALRWIQLGSIGLGLAPMVWLYARAPGAEAAHIALDGAWAEETSNRRGDDT